MDRLTTITTPATTYDLTTLAMVKAELGITATTYDALLSQYISSESAKIIAFCNRGFARETITEKFTLDYPYTQIALRLSRYPVASITSVVTSNETLSSDEYELDATGILYRLADSSDDDTRLPWACAYVTVVYVAGYLAVPAAVADACLQLVSRRYFSKGRDSSVRSEEINGVASVSYRDGAASEAIPDDVAMILTQYVNYARS